MSKYLTFLVFPSGHTVKLDAEYSHKENAIGEAKYHAEHLPKGVTVEVYRRQEEKFELMDADAKVFGIGGSI